MIATMRALPFALAILCLATLAGCEACHGRSGGGDASPAMAESVRVPVDRDGVTLVVIDRALLERTPADFSDLDRKAWRLRTLVGPTAFDRGSTIEVEDGQGVKVLLAQPSDLAEGRDPVLTVNRQGELRMAVLRPDDDVFASFHGRGGNRGRGGEPGRVREVRHIWLRSADAAASVRGADAGEPGGRLQ